MSVPTLGEESMFYNEVVNVIVDMVNKEYPANGDARMRCYARIADSFDGLVRSMTVTTPHAQIEGE